MKLSIIIVNTNEGHVLKPCLDSVFSETKSFEFEVLVVDNASTDGSREMLAREFPSVRMIRNATNLGFAASNNRAIREAVGEYVLLLNPDTVLLDRAIEKTVRFMDDHPAVGAVGCKLKFPNGEIQQSVGRFPSVAIQLMETSFLSLLQKPIDYNRAQKVEWVCGACLLTRAEFMERLGGLDEQFFMYTEEVDFTYRLNQAGGEVWYIPEAEVIHFWGGMSAASRRTVYWTLRSQLLFYEKHLRGVHRSAAIVLKYIGIGTRVAVYFLVGCISFRLKWLSKSGYFLFALYKLLIDRPKYCPNLQGPIVPWPRV